MRVRRRPGGRVLSSHNLDTLGVLRRRGSMGRKAGEENHGGPGHGRWMTKPDSSVGFTSDKRVLC